MIRDFQIFNDETLNIFTDASIVTACTGESIGCAGAHVCTGKNPFDKVIEQPYMIYRECTNNKAEISAVLLGVQAALKYRANYKTINLFSDSKICIYGLREWIYNWIKKTPANSEIMIGSQNTEVANQHIFLQIIYFIINNNLQINLWHQKGHVTSTEASLNNAANVFRQSNGVSVDMNLIRFLSDANNCVDGFTRDLGNTFVESFDQGINNGMTVTYQDLIRFFYGPIDVETYSSLIERRI